MPTITTVGFLPVTNKIVTGKVNTDKGLWAPARTDVTQAALCAAAEYLLKNNSAYVFESKGVKYSLMAVLEGSSNESN